MWPGTNTNKHLPIGVDLGSSSLKVAQIERTQSGLALLGAGSVEIPHEYRNDRAAIFDFQSGSIHKLLKTGEFKGRKAVLSLPASSTFIMQIKVPAALSTHLDDAVKNELRDKLTYPVEDAVIRHCLVGNVYGGGEEMQELFVVAAMRSEVDAYIDAAHRAGLKVVGIDIEACAIVECFARLLRGGSDESSVTLFIDIGWLTTQIVLAHGRRIAFARNLPVGGRALDQGVADALKIPIEQACRIRMKMLQEQKNSAAEDDLFRILDDKIAEITDEITRCMRYHESIFTDRHIERVIFVGGQAHNSRLCEAIAKRLNLPAQIGDPMTGISWPEKGSFGGGADSRQPLPAWAVAIGLSLSTEVTPFGGVIGEGEPAEQNAMA